MTDDQTHFQFAVHRHMVRDMDVQDFASVRSWILAQVERDVRIDGTLPPLFRYLREGFQDVVDLGRVQELGDEHMLAAAFRSIGQREGIRRYLRQGEVLLRDETGALRRAAAILVLDPATEELPERWWRAWRFFGRGEAGMGSFFGSWREREGSGLSELEEPFVEWLDAGSAQVSEQHFSQPRSTVPEDFDLRMALLDRPPVPPDNAAKLVVGLGRSLDQELLTQGLSYVLIFLLTSTALERYEVRGSMPCDLDDMVRNLALLGDPSAVAVVLPGTVNYRDGTTRRAIHVIGELAGVADRARRILPLRFEADGRPVALDEIVQRMEVTDDNRWLGVEPDARVELRPLDWGSGAGPEIEA